QLAKEFYKAWGKVQLVNIYGSTEVGADATYYNVDRYYVEDTTEDENKYTVPIGKPISNTSILILNNQNELQPLGVSGEICIQGYGVSAGYINQEVVDERFIESPFEEGTLLYRTGDLGVWSADGNLEYIGRLDDQVKIRGHRIGFKEIENVLVRHERINEAIVRLKGKAEDKYLTGYYTSEKEIELEVLKKHLYATLPDYMVPSHFVHLENFSLLSNGKVNLKDLPEPQINLDNFIPPSNDIEKELVEIWSEVLKLPTNVIGANTSFFELGGHSIRAVQLINKVQNAFSVKIDLRDIFETNTVSGMAVIIGNNTLTSKTVINKAQIKPYYRASPAQERLFFGYLIDTEDTGRNISASIELGKEIEIVRLEKALHQMVQRHSVLRTSFELKDGGVFQRIESNINLKIESITCPEKKLLPKYFENFIRPFNLSRGPLIRLGLVNGPNLKYLFVDIHHIVCDGMSINILIRDLKGLYFLEKLPKIEYEYTDFSEWVRTGKKNEAFHRNYWSTQLSGKIKKLNLPILQERESIDGNSCSTKTLRLKDETYKSIKSFSSQEGVTDFMFFLSIYYLMLNKITGDKDVIIGSDSLGRNESFDKTVGTFVNPLPLRMKIKGSYKYSTLLGKVKELVLKALEHQEYPFNEILSIIDPRVEQLFLVHFAFLNIIDSQREIDKLQFKNVHLLERTSIEYELQVEVLDNSENFNIFFHYNNSLYDEDTIQVFLETYQSILNFVLTNEKVKIRNLKFG
ncbi:condensation domain-containing protein, partial [Maribacter sp. 2307UL18-2]|uniref:condensation domain-containing protein n=1 Tax=Maribacter sp. 2307UL18-2 TaxID=3386274 RepID=UPI0039BCE0A9